MSEDKDIYNLDDKWFISYGALQSWTLLLHQILNPKVEWQESELEMAKDAIEIMKEHARKLQADMEKRF